MRGRVGDGALTGLCGLRGGGGGVQVEQDWQVVLGVAGQLCFAL